MFPKKDSKCCQNGPKNGPQMTPTVFQKKRIKNTHKMAPKSVPKQPPKCPQKRTQSIPKMAPKAFPKWPPKGPKPPPEMDSKCPQNVPSPGSLTLAAVGDRTFFFFLILMPGTGAEFRASRNPRPSMAGGAQGGHQKTPNPPQNGSEISP